MPKDDAHGDDPMELRAVSFPGQSEGDVREMTCSIIEEYMRIGWNRDSILKLFRNPHFRMTHTIYREKGETFVQEMIERVTFTRLVR